MARRRMFITEFVDADRFMDLPPNVQMLYMYMNLHADDEGFVGGSKRMANLYGCPDGVRQLEDSGFVIRFDSGIVAIVDWFLNNTIRKDRSTATFHQEERQQLQLVNGRYSLMTTGCQPTDNQMATNCQPSDNQVATTMQPTVNHMATQNRIEENRVEENSIEDIRKENNNIDNNRSEYSIPIHSHIPENGNETPDENIQPSIADVDVYCQEHGLRVEPIEFWSYYYRRQWKDENGDPIKDWRALMQTWHKTQRDPLVKPYVFDG